QRFGYAVRMEPAICLECCFPDGEVCPWYIKRIYFFHRWAEIDQAELAEHAHSRLELDPHPIQPGWRLHFVMGISRPTCEQHLRVAERLAQRLQPRRGDKNVVIQESQDFSSRLSGAEMASSEKTGGFVVEVSPILFRKPIFDFATDGAGVID